MNQLALVMAFVAGLVLGNDADTAKTAAARAPVERQLTLPEQLEPAPMCTPREQCCKVCNAGKACGDSCISRDYECHKGPGCACNASDVCG